MTRSIQEIFDLAITEGCYDPSVTSLEAIESHVKVPYMCGALEHNLYRAERITEKELQKCLDSINKFIKELDPSAYPYTTLRTTIYNVTGIYPMPKDLIKIYKNWSHKKRILKSIINQHRH